MWGAIADDTNFIEKINFVLSNIGNYSPRKYFIDKYSTNICKQNWIDLINKI
jgi:hypothetical protein